MRGKSRVEYAKLFNDGEKYSLHRERKGVKLFRPEWDNDVEALNVLAAEGWELATTYMEEHKIGKHRMWLPEHILRRSWR